MTGLWSDGSSIPAEICHKILKLQSTSYDLRNFANDTKIENQHKIDIENTIGELEQYNAQVFKDEVNYIDNWADAMLEKIQLSISEMRKDRKKLQIDYDFSTNDDERVKIQEEIHKISKTINNSLIELAQAENDIEDRRFTLINNLKAEKDKNIDVIDLLDMEFCLS